MGGALAESGLKRRTALGTATLLVAANAPDVDVLAYAWDPVTALAVRRGITHGVLALALWPFVIAGVMALWHQWVWRRRRGAPAFRVSQVMLLAAMGVATHPLLDFLNTYGMRWFMPFSGTWLYGDTLFIVDPWVWGALAVGIVAARRRPSAAWNPAALALALLAAYVVAMAGLGLYARRAVSREWRDRGMGEPVRLMAAPVPVTPLRRWIVFEHGGRYHFGWYRFLQHPAFELEAFTVAAEWDPRSSEAREQPGARKFLSWARFPFDEVGPHAVWLGDARYTVDPETSWAAVRLDAGGAQGTAGEGGAK